jgi:hypothetical protein
VFTDLPQKEICVLHYRSCGCLRLLLRFILSSVFIAAFEGLATEFNISAANACEFYSTMSQASHSRAGDSPVVNSQVANLPLAAARLIVELNIELLVTAFAVACTTA